MGEMGPMGGIGPTEGEVREGGHHGERWRM